MRVVVVEGVVTSFREGSDAQSDYYCRYGGNDGHVNSKGHGGAHSLLCMKACPSDSHHWGISQMELFRN